MQTTLERMLKLSVRLNGLLIPAPAVESTLARYTEPLLIWNHMDDYPCSLMGSGVAIHYKNRYLLLCTRHQLKVLDGRLSDNVGLLDKDGVVFCSSAGIQYFDEAANDTDLHDLVVFDFTKPCQERPIMRERFFNQKECPPAVSSNDVVAFVASGFPSYNQKYNLAEQQLGFVKATVPCLLADYSEQIKSDPALLRLKALKPLTFNPDGISGGAAFVVQLVGGKPCAYLAGMIVRAGSEDIYIVKTRNILRVIDAWLPAQQLEDNP